MTKDRRLSFVTEKVVNTLQLSRRSASIPLIGIGGTYSGRTNGTVSLILESIHDPSSTCSINAFILPRLTTKVPSFDTTNHHWRHIDGLPLADPDFFRSGFIDLIIGSDNYCSIILVSSEEIKTSLLHKIRSLAGYCQVLLLEIKSLAQHMNFIAPLIMSCRIFLLGFESKKKSLPQQLQFYNQTTSSKTLCHWTIWTWPWNRTTILRSPSPCGRSRTEQHYIAASHFQYLESYQQ